MGKSYIYGNGGHARVIASFLEDEATFLVMGAASAGNEMSQDAFNALLDGTPHGEFQGNVYIGVGDNAARTRIYKMLRGQGVTPAICIAPNAFVARDAVIDPGAVICAGAVIGSRARIGANTIVNTLSGVDHDCELGDHSQVTVGVTLGGTVKTGKNCYFGMKSAVFPNVTIGDNVQVMAGSLVTKPVPSDVMVGGVPAEIVRAGKG